jgi:hypothetical protein
VQTLLSEDELQAIADRAQSARPGPWESFLEGRDHTSGSSFIRVGHGTSRGEDIELVGATAGDQDFIAAARQDVPRLLSDIRELRRLLSVQSSRPPSPGG